MIAIILAGGYGRRLMPLSEFIPKQLLPIAGKPLLTHILDNISDVEFDKAIISTNSRFSDQFVHYVDLMQPRYNKKLKLVIEPTRREEEKFGAVKGLNYVLNEERVSGDFVVIAGDNFFDFKLRSIFDKFHKINQNVIGLYDVKYKEEAKRFGVVDIDNTGKVINLTEKPENPDSTLISMGLYVFKEDTKELIEEYINSSKNVDHLGSLISWMLSKTTIYSQVYSGMWVDIGVIEAYRKLIEYLNSKRV